MSPIRLDWPLGLDAIGWLIVHSAWQFLLLGVAAWLIADVLLRRRSASARYLVFGASLAATVICPVVTWFWLVDAAPLREMPMSESNYEVSIAQNDGEVTPDTSPFAPQAISPITTPAVEEVAAAPVVSPAREVNSNQPWLESAVAGIQAWLPWIAMFWCAGVTVLALRLALGWWRVERLKRTGREVHDPALLSLLSTAIGKLQVRRSVRLLVSDLIESPVVVGALRSVILVPASFVSHVSPDHIEAILAHELAHIRRYDYLVNLLQTAIETIFFYHPAVWWLSHRMRIERENCCDDLAAAAMASPVVYSRALMALEEMRGERLSPALGAKDGVLVTRIRRLLGLPVRQNSTFASGTIVAVIGVTLGLVLLAGFSSLHAEEPPAEEEEGFVAKLDDELSVELVGVWPHVSNMEEVQLPDGTQLEKLPIRSSYLQVTHDRMQHFMRDSTVLIFKFRGLSGGLQTSYETEGTQLSIFPDQNGLSLLAIDPAWVDDTGSITVGIGDSEFGPWRKYNTKGELIEPVHLTPRYQEVYDLIQLHDIEAPSDQVVYVLWTNTQEEGKRALMELAMVDKSGNRHTRPPYKRRWDDESGTPREGDGFNLPISEIDHFEYRLRPIRHWVTFDNVSMKPGVETEVKIEQSDVPIPKPNDSQATYRGRIVLPDGSPATDKGWLYQTAKTPEGSYLGTVGQYQDEFEFQAKYGTTHFSYFPDEHAPVWTDNMEVGPGDVVEGINLVLRPGIDVSVNVRNEAGEPIPGAVVVAHPVIHDSSNGPVFKHPVDATGNLTLTHLAESEYTFRVEAPGYEDLHSKPMPVSADKPVILVLHEAAPTTGIVYDTEGKPAVGAKLIAVAEVYQGGTNFISDQGRHSFIGQTWATTDAEGRFSLTELSRDRRYLFVVEGPDKSRLLYRDMRAGQSDVEIRLPRRHDLHLALRGLLDEYVGPGFENRLKVSQHFSFQTDIGNAGAACGASVLIRPNATGGTAVYEGLIVDPEADLSQQTVEVSFGTKKKYEQELQLSDQPVHSYTLTVGPIPEVPIRFPSATTHRLNSGRIGPQAILFHSEGHPHWMLYQKGFLQTGLEMSRWFDLKHTHLAWRFRGNINAFSGERKVVDGKNEWEHKRVYTVNFEYAPPDLTLKFDGQEIDFNKGRVIFLDEETGDPIQLDLTLPEPEQLRDEAFMAKFEEQVDAALAKRAKAEPSSD